MFGASPGVSRLVWSELGRFLGLHHGVGGYAGSVGIPGVVRIFRDHAARVEAADGATWRDE